MAIRYLAGGLIEGLSSDTKPATAQANSVFYETDTKATFNLISGTWTQKLTSMSDVGVDSSKSFGLHTISDVFLEAVDVSGNEQGVVNTEVYVVKKMNITGNATLNIDVGGEVSII